jgi:hypothetical protein
VRHLEPDIRGFAGAALALAFGLAALTAMAAPSPARPGTEAVRVRESPPKPLEPAQRARLQQRVRAWDALPLEQRLERRERYAAWRALTASERAQLRAMAAQVAGFDPVREQALRSQFEALDQSEQRAWRLGPHLGAHYDALQPLLAYVPPGQRTALLALLRSMPAAQQADLAVLVQRTPPQGRQALRQDLLALPANLRGAWLKQRLAQ